MAETPTSSTSSTSSTSTTDTSAQRTDTGTQQATQQTGATQTQQTTDTGTQTALSDTGGGKQVTALADWPADWRDKLAGNDDKVKSRLGRFQSVNDLWKSYTNLEQRMSSGQLKAQLPADAAPEDVARWRQENGIPEKADGYLEKLPQGIITNDDDKALVAPVLEALHAKNASPEVVATALEAWSKVRETVQAEEAEADAGFKTATEDELRQEWGADYRRNVNVINGWLDTAPEGVKATLLNARGPDGRPIASDPNVLRFLLDGAMNANPAATVAPGTPGASQQTIETEIATIEKTMRTNRAEYNKDPKMQARYLELLRAREALGQRGRAA